MEKKVRFRSLVIGMIISILFLSLVGRLYWVQVVEAAQLQEMAAVKRQDRELLKAQRGSILDRNNKTFAEDSVAYTVALNPQIINSRKNEREIARGLALILKTTEDAKALAALEEKIYDYATKKKADGVNFLVDAEIRSEGLKVDGEKKLLIDQLIVELQEKANKESKQKIKDVGIILKEEQKRYYPNNQLASHVLGYTDREGRPVGGVESTFNSFLTGKDGEINRQTDRKGIELPDTKATIIPAINGNNVRLTIDQNIQYYTENALKKAYDKYNPKSMTAIAVDPQTMEILAMASAPDFNPNRYWEVPQDNFINRAISSQYEPGSTFKLVTLAGAIQEGMFNPNEYYKSGSIPIADRILHDYNQSWGKITYMDGLILSSNVAFVKLGFERLGTTLFKDYIQRFGFGAKSGISLPYEVAGKIALNRNVEYATATYGQGGITTTALQQVMAYAAIANGGKLLKPQIVKEIVDAQTGEIIQAFSPELIRQVVSENTAAQAVLDLEQVVANKKGTGYKFNVDGFRVAGKTGTANFVEGGKYAEGRWNISFVGFAPVENPRILVAVIAEDPDLKGDFHGGSGVTSPVFKEIVSSSLSYMGVSTTVTTKKTAEWNDTVMVPDVSQQTTAQAKNMLSQLGLIGEVLGSSGTITKQYPLPGTEVSSDHVVYYLTKDDSSDLTIPDLAKKSVRDVLEVCQFINLDCKISGEGYAFKQSLTEEGGKRLLTVEFASIENTPKSPTPTPAKKTTTTASKVTPTPVKKTNPTPTPTVPQARTTAR